MALGRSKSDWCDVKEDAKDGEGNDDTCDGGVDGPRVPRQSQGERKGDLEYDGRPSMSR